MKGDSTKLSRIIGRYDGPKRGPLLIALGSMHGNEPAGVLALQELFRMLEREPTHNPTFAYRGRLLALRGNLQAIAENRRFLTKDLNRQLTPENIQRVRSVPVDRLHAEDRELRELLDTIDTEVKDYQPEELIVLDLHTTTAHGGIFSIATRHPRSVELARAMHAPVITGMLDGLCGTTLHHFTSDNYPCPTHAVTFEAGQHNAPEAVQHAVAAIVNLLRSIGSVRPEDVENRHDEVLINYSSGLPNVARLSYVHRIQPHDTFVMRPGFRNFQPIYAGEHLATDQNGPIRARMDGHLLMPLYQPQGEDGFFVIQEV
ncbi:MAG: succinylglutamate desuccinylase/aspartoacylase family protein [Bacteroidota bacterium]